MVEPMDEHPDLNRRFGGISRLYGDGTHAFLNQRVHAMVVGVGGVGSWAAEALARSGVGHITLVDMDHVAESNINRQIQATDATLGREKSRLWPIIFMAISRSAKLLWWMRSWSLTMHRPY